MRRKLFSPLLITFFVSILVLTSCTQEKTPDADRPQDAKSKLEKLKLAEGFRAEHLYSPSANEQGSWVSMTFDDKGRLITSDQYGALYRMELAPIGSSTAPKIEKLIIGTAESQRVIRFDRRS